MRGVHGSARQRALVGAEPGTFNATPLVVLGAGVALLVSVIRNERELNKIAKRGG